MNYVEKLSKLVKNTIQDVELFPEVSEDNLKDPEEHIEENHPIQKVWLTLNHVCNLKCKWCYDSPNANNCSKRDMPFDLAKKIIDFSKDVGAKYIILMGGEPTLYSNFFELIKYIKSKGLKVYAITNGHVFSNKEFLNKTIESQIDSISVCVKASNSSQQIAVTGTDSFKTFLKVLENLRESKGLNYDFTTVISKINEDKLVEFAELIAKNAPGKLLSYRFCSPCIVLDGVNNDYAISRYESIPKIVKQFEKAIEILGKNVEFRQSYPFCFWPKSFINRLKEENIFSPGCLLRSKKRNGITFDSEGNIILCNWFHAYPMAKFGEDFSNKEEFKKIWNSEPIKDIYSSLQNPPDSKCSKCKSYFECKGGCFARWLDANGMKN